MKQAKEHHGRRAAVKKKIKKEITLRYRELKELSLKIHDNPEVGYKEKKACAWLTQYLEENGFSVERGVCKLRTAFRARYGEGKPVVSIIAEYDALPKIGHGCGHNLIAGSAAGAGIGSRIAVDRFGGTVLVIGTPAEELGGRGGKITMADKGAFDDVDAAMMVHPSWMDIASVNNSSLETLNVEFFGKGAHAAMPGAGINALAAMIQSFNAINALRQRLKNQGAVHGIITDGGTAANVIPAYCSGSFMVRGESDGLLDEIKENVINCFVGAAKATGARLEYRWAKRMMAMQYNTSLARLFAGNMKTLGRTMQFVRQRSPASSDIGNVSRRVPTINALFKAVPEGTVGHSPQMTEAAASESALQAMLAAGTGMAMTVADLVAEPDLLKKVKREFRRTFAK